MKNKFLIDAVIWAVIILSSFGLGYCFNEMQAIDRYKEVAKGQYCVKIDDVVYIISGKKVE